MTEEKEQCPKNKIKFVFPATCMINSPFPKPIVEMINNAIIYEEKRVIYGDVVYNDAVLLMQSTIDLDFETCLQICQEKRAKELIDELRSSVRILND